MVAAHTDRPARDQLVKHRLGVRTAVGDVAQDDDGEIAERPEQWFSFSSSSVTGGNKRSSGTFLPWRQAWRRPGNLDRRGRAKW